MRKKYLRSRKKGFSLKKAKRIAKKRRIKLRNYQKQRVGFRL